MDLEICQQHRIIKAWEADLSRIRDICEERVLVGFGQPSANLGIDSKRPLAPIALALGPVTQNDFSAKIL